MCVLAHCVPMFPFISILSNERCRILESIETDGTLIRNQRCEPFINKMRVKWYLPFISLAAKKGLKNFWIYKDLFCLKNDILDFVYYFFYISRFLNNQNLNFIVLILPFKRQPNLPTNCLSVFDHFVGLALKGLIIIRETEIIHYTRKMYTYWYVLQGSKTD